MNIVFIGCGNMGSAIVSGMLQSHDFSAEQISAVLPSLSPDILKIQDTLKIRVYSRLPKNKEFDIIIFAVKPQTLHTILPIYQEELKGQKPLIISIAAGIDLRAFEEFFPIQKIIRTMPNLNAMVGKGSTIGFSNTELLPEEKEVVEKIFKAIGNYYWADEESQLDAVTAISGSGPAYFFAFTKYLYEAALKLGLPEEIAKNISQETFIGAAEVLAKSGKSPTELMEAVTSKGGTTAAALDTFNKDNALKTLLEDATKAAKNRAAELSEKN